MNPEICAANASQGWIAVDDSFQSGHDVIPGHVNCRCTIRYRTGELYDAANVAIVGKLDSFRCPECNKLLKDHAQPGAVYWCRRCKADRKAPGMLAPQKPMFRRRQEIERDEYGAMVAVVTMEE